MKCSRCQHENASEARYCSACGVSLELNCPSCGHGNAPSSLFCNQCGHALNGPDAAASAQHFVSPESYTPKHLAERILTSKAALEGERKQVTVLFADVKGSMELLGDRDPEEVRKLLDPVLTLMMEAVHRYEGTVNQVMGDGIMALFGAPLAHEDHAVRACYAALRMQDVVRRYSEELRRAQGVEVQIRVGLNSGEVVVRSIGSDLRMDYSAVGQTTNLAARMEQLAAPGSIRVTAGTLHLAEGFVQVTPLGPVPIKGLGEPVEVFELVGAGAARTRLEAAVRRGLTRFVGRSAELEQLRSALDRANLGHGQVVAVVGDPGVGKSRLFWELTHSHRVHRWLIVQSASVSYGKATAYLPMIELLRGYFEIESRDDPRRIREKVTGKVLTLAPALAPVVPALLALLDVPVDEAPWHTLDPLQRRQQTLDAVKRLLLRESEVQPLMVVFEDLHWIDGETQTLLDSLVDSLPAARLLLLVNYRPEYSHVWGGKTYYRQLRIDPLPPESADELLEALLGTDAALGPLKQLLVERTEANPLFLEESVRALVETAALAGERGAYRLTRPVEHLKIPATVQAILAARIDRLVPEAKRLLQAAAVIGKDVALPLLLAIADAPEHEVRAELTRLQAAEFLYEARLFPDLEYTFKHALTHEVAYGGLLHDRQRALHARITEAIERLAPERVAEQAERLAHHALRGEQWDKALSYCRQAGAKAVSRAGYREAVTYGEQALVVLTHLPDDHERRAQKIDVHLALQASLWQVGEVPRMIDLLEQAESLAMALGDENRLGAVFLDTSFHLFLIGQQDRALEAGQRALAIAKNRGDTSLEIETNLNLGRIYTTLGDYRAAMDCLRWNVTALEGDRLRERFGERYGEGGIPNLQSRSWLGRCLAERGAFGDALALAEGVMHTSERSTRPFTRVAACRDLGHVYLWRGDVDKAIPILEHGLSICRAAPVPGLLPIVASLLGSAYTLAGRIAEGLPLLALAVAQAASIGLMYGHSLWVSLLGEGYLLAGRLEEAHARAVEALSFARTHHERAYEATALQLLGEIHAQRDSSVIEPAEECYQRAVALASELDMRPLVAHCHLGLGKLYKRTGKREQAREHLTTATTMYGEMDMRFWLEQVERELSGT
jgi:class 3 adenylate cyclase/tetratricopeptide (TPR) repeat protein